MTKYIRNPPPKKDQNTPEVLKKWSKYAQNLQIDQNISKTLKMTKITTKTSKIPDIPLVTLKYGKYPNISKKLYEEKMNNIVSLYRYVKFGWIWGIFQLSQFRLIWLLHWGDFVMCDKKWTLVETFKYGFQI